MGQGGEREGFPNGENNLALDLGKGSRLLAYNRDLRIQMEAFEFERFWLLSELKKEMAKQEPQREVLSNSLPEAGRCAGRGHSFASQALGSHVAFAATKGTSPF